MIVLRTARLELRLLELEDAAFILQLLNEDAFLRYIGDKGVRTIADAKEYIATGPRDSYTRHGYGLYLTQIKQGPPIGICGLVRRDTLPSADLGFAFLGSYVSQGYATEAGRAVIDFWQTTAGMHRILAITALDNHASMAVLRKLGMKFERKIKLVANGEEINLFATTPIGEPSSSTSR